MDLGMVSLPVYTALLAAVLMAMQMILMGRVIANRGKHEIAIGSGGVDVMEQTIRVHGNFVENAPTFLIGLALIELLGGTQVWVLSLAGVFLAGRIAHAIGYSMTSGVSKGRLFGTMASILVTFVAAGYLFYLAIGRL